MRFGERINAWNDTSFGSLSAPAGAALGLGAAAPAKTLKRHRPSLEVGKKQHGTIAAMAKSLVVANWKMNPPSWREAKRLLEETKHLASMASHTTIVVAPPALYLRQLAKEIRGGKVLFAAQNAHFEPSGAHTGEISMQQAKEAGASYVIIGHAERREMGESNDDTRRKVTAALFTKLIPILCVGEKVRTQGAEHFGIVREQLRVGLTDVSARVNRVIVTYEPLWAIGGATAMAPRDMHEMAIFIRKTVVELHGEIGHKMKILYGGSVDSTNAVAMLAHGDTSGFLVGRASIHASEFGALLDALK